MTFVEILFFTIMVGVGGIGFEKLILVVYRESRDRMHGNLRSPILRDLGTRQSWYTNVCRNLLRDFAVLVHKRLWKHVTSELL